MKESKASDERLLAMTNLRNKLKTWGEGKIDGDEAIGTTRNIWKLSEEEGYWSEYVDFF